MLNKQIKLMVPDIGQEELKSIKHVIESSFITEGSVTKLFEKKFSKYINANFAVATTSGTTALELLVKEMKS